MKQLAYSSIAAFLAHCRALSNAATRPDGTYPLSAEDHETLDAMHQLMATFTPEERAILLADASCEGGRTSGEKARRRERAQLKLRRVLLSSGILT